MRVVGPNPYSNVAGRAPVRRRNSGSGFSADAQESSETSSGTGGLTALHSVDALLSLQEVGDSTSERKKALRRGHELLDELDAIHLDLLAGKLSEQRLDRLLLLLAARNPSGDSRIESVIGEIELRAQVELAKRNRSPL